MKRSDFIELTIKMNVRHTDVYSEELEQFAERCGIPLRRHTVQPGVKQKIGKRLNLSAGKSSTSTQKYSLEEIRNYMRYAGTEISPHLTEQIRTHLASDGIQEKAAYEYFTLPKSETYRSPFAGGRDPITYLTEIRRNVLMGKISEELKQLDNTSYYSHWQRFQKALESEYIAFTSEEEQFRTADRAVRAVTLPFEYYLIPLIDGFSALFQNSGAIGEIGSVLELLNCYISEVLCFYTYGNLPHPGEKPTDRQYNYFTVRRAHNPERIGQIKTIMRLPYCIDYPLRNNIVPAIIQGVLVIYGNLRGN